MTEQKQINIESEMLPFVIKELAAMVMQKKSLTLEEALYYIYSSDIYNSIQDKDTKMWYLSTLALYDMLEKEKAEQRKRQECDNKILLFKVFCIENYREKAKLTSKKTLQLFEEHDVFGFLNDTFETLHTQDPEYIIDTISTYIRKRKKK